MSRIIKSEKDVKLKFGIDRLLSNEPFVPGDKIVKPLATVPVVPCSDCVTSLFRCCRLSPSGGCAQDTLGDFMGHHGITAAPSSGVYTVQPIRPFATRPGKITIK